MWLFLSSTAYFICLSFLRHNWPHAFYPKLRCIQFSLQNLELLTPVHSNTDDTDDYSSLIGIALLKAFLCANKDQEDNIYNSQVDEGENKKAKFRKMQRNNTPIFLVKDNCKSLTYCLITEKQKVPADTEG